MKVRRVTISGFRGVRSGKVLLDSHSLLVGVNAVGKSTVCEALDLALGLERLSRHPVIDEYDFYEARYRDDEPETGRPSEIRSPGPDAGWDFRTWHPGAWRDWIALNGWCARGYRFRGRPASGSALEVRVPGRTGPGDCPSAPGRGPGPARLAGGAGDRRSGHREDRGRRAVVRRPWTRSPGNG